MDKLKISLFIILSMCFSPASHAIQCKNANLDWEKTVCASKKLLQLDRILNKEYSTCHNDDIRYIRSNPSEELSSGSQQYWLANNEGKTESELIDRYNDRIIKMKYCNKEWKLIPSPYPDDPSSEVKLPYQMTKLQVSGVTFVEYPVLKDSSSKYANKINAHIAKIVHEHLNSDFYCSDNNDHEFHFSVYTIKASLYGVEVSDNDNCKCQCAYPEEQKSKYLWDLETGEDVYSTYDHPLTIINKSNFWDTVKQVNARNNLPKSEDTDGECGEYYKDFSSFSVNTGEDGIYGGWMAVNHATKACENGYLVEIPLLEAKPYYYFNEKFLTLLPRFIEAGLISKEGGDNIMKAAKSKPQQ